MRTLLTFSNLLAAKDIRNTKVVLWSYFFTHLAVASLLGWRIYRILGQKKKDKWSLITPIIFLVITLFIPYKGDKLMEFFGSALNSPSTFSTIFAFASLVMAIGCISLYFVMWRLEKVKREKSKN